MKQIVVLDGIVANPGDLSWDPLYEFGKVVIYDRTPQDLIVERAATADIILTNKCQLTKSILDKLPQLEYIGLLATGYNNIDVKAAHSKGITVCNAVGYGVPSVAQHVFALILEITNQVGAHSTAVRNNKWATSKDWCFWNKPILELQAKTLGIYGLGNIGQQVAKIGLAFGMHVIATRKNKDKGTIEGVRLVSDDELFRESDFLSLHAALTKENHHIIRKENIIKMKDNIIIINTGRGDLIHEADLKLALESGHIAGAALDVLHQEPPEFNHPLASTINCILTPHHAWAAKESRHRLLSIAFENIKSYIDGHPINICTVA
jgi:glycerate dehydrogenase